MVTLESVLKESYILSGCDFKLKYHEDVYHVDDLQRPEDHDKILSAGNRIFTLEVNFTKKTFELRRLCADTITGIVTEKDTYILLGYMSKYMTG